MAAEDVLAESLIRIEHKIDILFRALKIPPLLAPQLVPHGSYTCPLCKAAIQIQMDPVKNVAARKCQCTTGLIAINLDLLKVVQENGEAHERAGEDAASLVEQLEAAARRKEG